MSRFEPGYLLAAMDLMRDRGVDEAVAQLESLVKQESRRCDQWRHLKVNAFTDACHRNPDTPIWVLQSFLEWLEMTPHLLVGLQVNIEVPRPGRGIVVRMSCRIARQDYAAFGRAFEDEPTIRAFFRCHSELLSQLNLRMLGVFVEKPNLSE